MNYIIITNNPQLVKEFDSKNIFFMVDIERRGKINRQMNKGTFISDHVLEDILTLKLNLKNSKIITRVNSIYAKSSIEISKSLKYGSDYILLPFYKTQEEVHTFLKLLPKQDQGILLCETKEAFFEYERIHKNVKPFLFHIGLNDLHMELNFKFMFEILKLNQFKKISDYFSGVSNFGFGGISSLEEGIIPGKFILKEHHFFNSNFVILSRSFFQKKSITQAKIDFIKLDEEFNKSFLKKDLRENHSKIIGLINNNFYNI